MERQTTQDKERGGEENNRQRQRVEREIEEETERERGAGRQEARLTEVNGAQGPFSVVCPAEVAPRARTEIA